MLLFLDTKNKLLIFLPGRKSWRITRFFLFQLSQNLMNYHRPFSRISLNWILRYFNYSDMRASICWFSLMGICMYIVFLAPIRQAWSCQILRLIFLKIIRLKVRRGLKYYILRVWVPHAGENLFTTRVNSFNPIQKSKTKCE